MRTTVVWNQLCLDSLDIRTKYRKLQSAHQWQSQTFGGRVSNVLKSFPAQLTVAGKHRGDVGFLLGGFLTATAALTPFTSPPHSQNTSRDVSDALRSHRLSFLQLLAYFSWSPAASFTVFYFTCTHTLFVFLILAHLLARTLTLVWVCGVSDKCIGKGNNK